jgi:DNA-binding transcriptional ArsR family regulator
MDVDRIEHSAAVAAKLLKAIANQRRLLILCHLAQGEKSVGQLEAQMNLSQPRLSQELARLRQDGLVRTRRDSRTIHYTLVDGRAKKLIGHLYELFCAEAPAEIVVGKHDAERQHGSEVVNETGRQDDLAELGLVEPGLDHDRVNDGNRRRRQSDAGDLCLRPRPARNKMGKGQHTEIGGNKTDGTDAHRRPEIAADDGDIDLGACQKRQQDRAGPRDNRPTGSR